MTSTLRIGAGSAWWGDRVEPAALNAEKGDLDYLCFETMAEATISAAQVRARRDPTFPGYDTYLDDRMRQDAIVRRLEVIGEAVKQLSESSRTAEPDIPWRRIAGMRDRLIHGYAGVDLEIVWRVVEDELPPLERAVRRMLGEG